MKPKYLRNIDELQALSQIERDELKKVTSLYPFYSNDYYLGLIDWNDPNDPIRKIIIPTLEEAIEGGSLDPSNEKNFTVCRGLEHKYGPTALILASQTCGGLCRFCFRKRLFKSDNTEAIPDIIGIIQYLKNHEEINNILISGGDPLILSTDYLKNLLTQFFSIKHVDYIRIGTKMPVYNPYRILDDHELIDMVKHFSKSDRKLYFITNINHPRELTQQAVEALDLLITAGAVISNQTPLLKGINDDKDTLIELFNKLASLGIPPYYVFQCRPTVGNRPFMIPIEKGYRIFEEAKAELSGLAKRSRFIMSHSQGKLEIVAMTDTDIIFKFHNAAHEENNSKLLVYKRNPNAFWLDDYDELIGSHRPSVEYNIGL